MNTELTVKSLDRLGLTMYEAKIYLALLNKQQMGAAEIARVAGVPRSRVYDSLRLLESKNLCRAVSDKVKVYSAIEPNNIMGILYKMEEDKTVSKIEEYREKIKIEEEKLAQKQRDAQKLVEQLSPIYKANRDNNHDIDYIEIVKDHEHLRKRVIALFTSAKKEIMSFCPPMPSVQDEMIAEQLEIQQKSIKRGVRWSAVYELPDEIEEIKRLQKYLINIKKIGERARVIKEIPVQMTLIDGKTVLFELEDPVSLKPAYTCSVIQHTRLAKGFELLFEATWQKAMDIEEIDKVINKMEKRKQTKRKLKMKNPPKSSGE